VGEALTALSAALSRCTPDEFALLLTTIFPIGMGVAAAFRTLTGSIQSHTVDDHTRASGTVEALSNRTEAALSLTNSNVQATFCRVEKQINDMQRAHDTRFADLHKDLAGIVWELSKLRADMARWQALAQLGKSSSPRSLALSASTLAQTLPTSAIPEPPADDAARTWRSAAP